MGVDQDPKLLSDDNLVKLFVQTKDTKYFSIIYDRYAKFVYNKSFSLVNDDAQAQDLTHDIFIKIYLNLRNFKFESKLSTWIYAITYNFCMNFIKKNKYKTTHEEALEEEVDEHSESTTSSAYAYQDDDDDGKALFEINYQRLLEILDQISIENKTILLMKYQEELSLKEIAEILQVTESTVKMRLKRAKQKVLDLR